METVNNILCVVVGLLLISVGCFSMYVWGVDSYNPYPLMTGICLCTGIVAVMFKGKALWDASRFGGISQDSKTHSNEANS